jgi:ankyrin repeat protein
VELLLANKADVNAKNNPSQTPLHYAAVYGHKDVALGLTFSWFKNVRL